MAKLRFVYAPMSSGKSLRLLSLAHDFSEKNISFMLLKPSADTRDGANVVKSRIGVEMKCIPVGTNDNIFDLVKDNYRLRMATFTKPIQWILVDECQFLTEAQIDQLSDVVDFMDVEVICYGLRTDFKSKLFPASKRLFELADELEEIKSYCDCGNKASINARFSPEGKIITEGSQILVGGDDLYHAICRKDWKKLIRETIMGENG
jgi:thymidine kinase